jgi:hypothetical protein
MNNTTSSANTFETGATTAQSNNLILSVINDSSVYEHRKHCIYAMLQGSTHSLTISDLVKNEASKQRLQGSKFQAAVISEAVKIVTKQTLENCLESLVSEWTGARIEVNRRGWWDGVNGNTYFSCMIKIPQAAGFRWFSVPMQGGYGNHWEFEAVAVLKRIGFGFDTPKNSPRWELPIDFNDHGDGLKRNMYKGIFL